MYRDNGYFSIWKNSVSGVLDWINFENAKLDVPGRTVDLIQLLPQPQSPQEWIGIVKITTPDMEPRVERRPIARGYNMD